MLRRATCNNYRVIDLDAKLDSQVSPLLRYAALHWPEHTESCSTLAANLFDPYGVFFRDNSPLRDYWWRTYIIKMKKKNQFGALLLPHVACILEIIPWIEAVVAKKSWWPRYHKHVKEKDGEGKTALHLVVLGGNKVVMRLLVDLGVDIEAKDSGGETALHLAVWGEKKAAVRLLVDLGADIEATDNYGKTVIDSAAERGNVVVVVWLPVGRSGVLRRGITKREWHSRGCFLKKKI